VASVAKLSGIPNASRNIASRSWDVAAKAGSSPPAARAAGGPARELEPRSAARPSQDPGNLGPPLPGCHNRRVPVASRERPSSDLGPLAHRGGGVRDFSLGAARILARAVPFDGVCVLTVDPATVLPTGEVVENGLPPAATPRVAEIERHGAVTQLVAKGLATNAIAGRLHTSPWTVQDHLKAIFEKVGVGTRGELTARLSFEHYAPRLRDAARASAP
jgi:DNA-binding CsgD family transcriptional regulator